MTDRELDALVAKKVMGLDVGGGCSHEFDVCLCFPGYSTNIDAAWMVVEKITGNGSSGNFDIVGPGEINKWCVHFYVHKGAVSYPSGSVIDVSAPRAICLAALKAVGVKVPA